MWLNLLLGVGVLVVVAVVWFAVYFWLSPHLNSPDGKARITGACGDTMEIQLKLKENKIINSSYWTNGCVYSLNCICAAAGLAKGKTPEQALDINADIIQKSVGGLPKDNIHCAALAAETLHAAIDNYIKSNINASPSNR